MKLGELRAGNYYLYKGAEIKFDISDFKEIDYGLLELLKPIPLTEQKLIEFGFIKNTGNVFENIILPYWVKDSVLLFFNIGQEEYSWKIGYGEMNFGKYFASTFRWINEVHILQNIYYDLTGKKL